MHPSCIGPVRAILRGIRHTHGLLGYAMKKPVCIRGRVGGVKGFGYYCELRLKRRNASLTIGRI